jgi:hypothetical protein
MRPQYRVFQFVGVSLDGRDISMRYRLAGGPDPDIDFEERISLPATLPAPDPNDPVVRRLLDGCLRVFGVSYYKAAVPPVIEAEPVCDADADFWDELYSEGMGEFYFRNGLSIRQSAKFPRGGSLPTLSPVPPEAKSSFVLLGGGKDSALVSDIVLDQGGRASAFSLGGSIWAQRSASAAGLELHTAKRTIDRQLLELNARGAWNGHVPISACIAFIATLAAYAARVENVIVGNERGADEHNVICDGFKINHQWSKSLRFETLFQQWCGRHLQGQTHYFSLLRPLSEIHIAKLFAGLPQHFENFTSCNVNFKISQAQAAQRWCGRCAKCVFVYLLMTPHLTPAQADSIFGANFLEQEHNRETLAALLGLRDIKPFDCVGTIDESRLSFSSLHRQQRLRGMAASLAQEHPEILHQAEFEALWQAHLLPTPEHRLAPSWLETLNAYLATHQ